MVIKIINWNWKDDGKLNNHIQHPHNITLKEKTREEKKNSIAWCLVQRKQLHVTKQVKPVTLRCKVYPFPVLFVSSLPRSVYLFMFYVNG